MTNFNLSYDSEYTHVFHSPGIEPWITGALKGRKLNKVIDVGCGFGLASVILKSYLSAEYLVGLDVDDVKVSRASPLYDVVVVSDACFMPFRDHVFDLALLLEVLHGLSIKCLDEVERISNGIVLALPRFNVEELLRRNYKVYRYLLRGFVLVDLHSYEVLTIPGSRLFRIVKFLLTILKPFMKALKVFRKGYLLAFKL
ncbi:MAG: class I SAM-dependent methyltransferase [Candidatus Korarchaeota archaeon]